MSSKPVSTRLGLGMRAQKGGSVLAGVAVDGNGPRLVLSTFLATATAGDRLALEPYHLAAVMERGPDGRATAQTAAMIADARKRQDALAAEGLAEIIRSLGHSGYEPVAAALLVNRAGWVSDLLDYSLAFAEHAAVAEGLAVREALRFACAQVGTRIVEMDEKSLPELASGGLALDAPQIDAHLKTLGASAGRPWRKEQKLACLAAWLAATAN